MSFPGLGTCQIGGQSVNCEFHRPCMERCYDVGLPKLERNTSCVCVAIEQLC